MAYNPNLPAGPAVAASSAPVVLATDQMQDILVTGAAAQSTLGNNILLGTAGSGGYDTWATSTTYRTMYCQVVTTSGVSAGQIIFEASNDNTNWFQITLQTESSNLVQNPAANMINLGASANRCYAGPIPARYVRCRISTAFSGGTVQAFTRFSVVPYAARTTTPFQQNPSQNAVSIQPGSYSGTSLNYSASLSNSPVLPTSAGQARSLYSYHLYNSNSSVAYVQFFNASSAGSVTVGTTSPQWSVGVPPNGVSQVSATVPWFFSNGIVIAATTTRAGSTAPASNIDVNISYA